VSGGSWIALASVAATLVATITGAWWTRRTAREAQKASPYEALATRVVALETADSKKGAQLSEQNRKIERQDRRIAEQDRVIESLRSELGDKGDEIVQLRDEVHTLVDHTITVQAWIDAGSPPPPPSLPENVAKLMRKLRADGHSGPLPSPRLDPQD